jgi:GNAT superfamily N-acetyltransferase
VTTVVLRAGTPADAEVLARIHLDSRAATMPYLPAGLHTDDEVVWWLRELVLPEQHSWVARSGAEVLGYAVVDGDVLEQLYLRPDHLRRGVGTLLLDAVKQHCPAGVTLRVFARNTAARAFYHRHGFTLISTADGSANEEGMPEHTLRWAGNGGSTDGDPQS